MLDDITAGSVVNFFLFCLSVSFSFHRVRLSGRIDEKGTKKMKSVNAEFLIAVNSSFCLEGLME